MTSPDREWLKIRLAELQMDAKAFAAACSRDVRTVLRWLAGVTWPSREDQITVALVLGLDAEAVLSRFALERTADTMRMVSQTETEASNNQPPNPHVDAVATLLELAMNRNPTLHVRQIRTLPELRALWEIDNRAYGHANVTYDVFKSWWTAYPAGLQAIFDDDVVVGAVGIWPVPTAWQEGFWAGHLSEDELTPEMLAAAARTVEPRWYISGIVLDASHQHTQAILCLLRQATIYWAQIASAEPSTISALAISPHGEKLLRRFSFSLVRDRAKDGFPIYARTVSKTDIPAMLG